MYIGRCVNKSKLLRYVRRMMTETRQVDFWTCLLQLIISRCSNLICCKRQIQSRFDEFLVDLSPFVAHKAGVCFCLHKVNVRCTSPTVNLSNGRIPWISDPLSTHMITTASKSKTAKWFVDSCLLCTTPRYYVWSSFDLLLLESLLAAVPCLFVTQCCHLIVGGTGRTISILIRKAP